MKTFKRTLAIMITCVMAITLCLATALTAFADEPATTYSITIKSGSDKPVVHTYEAYQIFKGTVSGSALSNIQWGDNIDSVALLTKLQSDPTLKTKDFTDGMEAEAVAEILKSFTDAETIAFATVAGESLKTTVAAKGPSEASGGNQVISGLEGGYYLIKDITSEGNPKALSRNMLKVAGNVDVTSKEVIPTITKKVTGPNANDDQNANTASIGDVIYYELTSTVPDMAGYKKYYFVIGDKMDSGLTFNGITEIKVGNKTLTAADYELRTTNAANGYTFEIVFKNFIQYNENDNISVKYTAILNSDANLTKDGNVNSADLTYSNDPNGQSKGEGSDTPDNPDDDDENYPGPGDATGKTLPSEVVTYSAEFELTKTGEGDDSAALAGAIFELIGGDDVTKISVETKGTMNLVTGDSVDGTVYYWLLNDGTYTTTAPDTEGGNRDKYAEPDKKYTLGNATETTGETLIIRMQATTGADGKILFKGLGEGTYTLKEVKAPENYNKLPYDIVFTISADKSDTGCTWSVNVTSPTDKGIVINVTQPTDAGNNAKLTLTVENKKGPQLPSTGGIGTKLFYLIGGLLAAGSAIYLITRKRMSIKEN